jgi:hypothetical protein
MPPKPESPHAVIEPSALGAWWQVDLGEEKNINQIIIYNRTDCCADRLSNNVLDCVAGFPRARLMLVA